MCQLPKCFIQLFFIFILVFPIVIAAHTEKDAAILLKSLERRLTYEESLLHQTFWNYQISANEENATRLKLASKQYVKFIRRIRKRLMKFDYKNFKNASIRRQFETLCEIGYAALPKPERNELVDILNSMKSRYANARVCQFKNNTNCNIPYMPDIKEIMAISRNPRELKHYWIEWHNQARGKDKGEFKRYIDLTRQSAQLNGYESHADFWLSQYEDPTIERQVDNLYSRFTVLYKQLHAYVRYRLKLKYGNIVKENGAIPIHLLGNMHGQNWQNIADLLLPFPEKVYSTSMKKKDYDIMKMFHIANDFVVSLNLTPFKNSFWKNSFITEVKSKQEKALCANGAYIFNNSDIRIFYCGSDDLDTLFEVYNLVGDAQVLVNYQHLPFAFRRGTIPAFDETFGNVLGLSGSSLKHLKRLGLLEEYNSTNEIIINNLLMRGLNDIAFLPFAYTLDKYRWDLFRGELKLDKMNCAYWKMRIHFTGIEPPAVRDEKGFDVAAKYQVAADMEYFRYYMATINQFQLYKISCIVGGEYFPSDVNLTLQDCDIYGNYHTGNMLKKIFSMGASKTWPELLEMLTGSRLISIDAMLEYFQPLLIWLQKQNQKNKVTTGWDKTIKCSYDLGRSSQIFYLHVALKVFLGFRIFMSQMVFITIYYKLLY